MPYSPSEKLRRVLLIALLAVVLLGVVLGIGLLAYNAGISHKVPYVYFGTYDELQAEFKNDEAVVFPDIAPLNFNYSESYKAWYTSGKRNKTQSYEVFGGRIVNAVDKRYSITGVKTDRLPENAGERTEYNGETIHSIAAEQRGELSCSEECWVSVNGCVYTINCDISPVSGELDKLIGDERFDALKADLHEQLLDIMRSIVDKAKAE